MATGGGGAKGSGANSRNDGLGGSSEDEGRGRNGGAGSGSGVGNEAGISLSDIMDELKGLRQVQMHELKALREGQTAIEAKIQRVTESVDQSLESIGSGGKSEQREQGNSPQSRSRSRGDKAATHAHTSSAELLNRRGASLATSKANAEVNHAVTAATGRSEDEVYELVMSPPMSESVLNVPEVPQGARMGSKSDAVSVVSRTLSQLIQENKALKQMTVDMPSRPTSAAVPVFFHGPVDLPSRLKSASVPLCPHNSGPHSFSI